LNGKTVKLDTTWNVCS